MPTLQKQQSITYREAFSFEEAWNFSILPWIKARPDSPAKSSRTGIVVPDSATGTFVKQRLMETNTSVFGIDFWTPGALRNLLIQELCPETKPLALREDLHLLMSLVAKNLGGNTIAAAIEKQPELLVHACDILSAAGWEASAFSDNTCKILADTYFRKLEEYSLNTIQKADAWLATKTRKSIPIFGDLLFYGFSSNHWESFHLLKSSIDAAETATLCFLADKSDDSIDQAWQGTWEEYFGISEKLPEALNETRKPFSSLPFNFEFPELTQTFEPKDRAPTYIVGENIIEEANAIAAQAIEYLSQKKCTRLGIVFGSQSSPLGREVSIRLEEYGIPHYDHLGHPPSQPLAQILFTTWIQWQENPKLPHFLDFLEYLNLKDKLPYATYKAFKQASLDSFRETMTEDLATIKAHMGHHSIWKAWPLLPRVAPFSSFLEKAKEILTLIGWPEDETLLDRRTRTLQNILNQPVSLTPFFNWLKEVTKPLGRTRCSLGNQLFSKVHIITASTAIRQCWSHLILGGLNKGLWPQNQEVSPFLNDEAINGLNSKTLAKGSQGEGHFVAKDARALILSETKKNAYIEYHFSQLIGMPTEGLTLTAHLKSDLEGTQEVTTSEYLDRLYLITEGTLLDQEALQRLQLKIKLAETPCAINKESIDQTLFAYKIRQNPNIPFNEYTFSFKNKPEGDLPFSCKSWEEALSNPAASWIKHILGISIPSDNAYMSNLTSGTWVHAWLHLKETNDKTPHFPTDARWKHSIKAQAEATRKKAQKAFEASGRTLPDWWLSQWHEDQKKALQLAEYVLALKKFLYLYSEYTLPKESKAHIPGLLEIALRGRIDAMGTTALLADKNASAHIWIIDYKTGSRNPLTLKQLEKGNGLQLALYTLALESKGYTNVSISILQPDKPPKASLPLEKITPLKKLWQGIESMNKTGVLGQWGPLRSDYTFVNEYPLATLAIAPDVLEKKWRLTHPGISR